MAWQDRHYYRDRSSGATNPLMWLLTGSVPLFTAFGIRVRAHASMLVFIGLTLLFAETSGGLGAKNAIVASTMVFAFVLLHEFGHCFGARLVGGDANDILMWPLGGLASVNPPHRPLPSFITTAAGPAVNLLFCIVTGVAIYALSRSASAIPWFPFQEGLRSYIPHDTVTYWLWWIFLVNYALFTFNMLLVFYPFDAGRMIQEVLWAFVGYYKSMRFATIVGMIGAGVVAVIAMVSWSLMLLLLAVFGFIACYQQRQLLRETGPEPWQESLGSGGFDYSSSLRDDDEKAKRRTLSQRRAERRAAKLAQAEREEQEKIDTILEKVSQQGMHSLSWWEKRTLRRATERQRQRDQLAGRTRRI